MSPIALTLWIASVLIALSSLFISLTLIAIRLNSRFAENPDMDEYLSLSVVIAARNEEASIKKTLESLSAQDGNISEIIVVDDGSCDKTPEIAQRAADRDARIRVVSAPELPEGWLGKTSALQHGANLATGDYILFTDADVVFSGNVLTRCIAFASARKLDHLGAMYTIESLSIAEQVCSPVLAMMATATLWISSVRGEGAGTGAFNLVRRASYSAVGGHNSIRGDVVDDVALAVLMKSAGYKTAFVDLASDVRVRLFEGLAGYWRCVSRSAVPYLSWPLAITSLVVALVGFASIYLLAGPIFFLIGLMSSESNFGAWVVTGYGLPFLTYLFGLIPVAISSRYSSGILLMAVFYPLALCIMVAAVAVSALRYSMGRPLRWRGREYSADTLFAKNTRRL